MSYGQWAPNWRTWRNRQTEAPNSPGNWQVREAPVWNWQARISLPLPLRPPPPRTWQTQVAPQGNWYSGQAPSWDQVAPQGNWYSGQAPSWDRRNGMATMESWLPAESDGIRNWQTELLPERNWHIRQNYYVWNWLTRPNRRERNWLQTGSLPWTNWQTEQDYSAFVPLYLALPAASEASGAVQDPGRPVEERMPPLLTGLQEIQEFPNQQQMQMPAQEELPRLTRTERRAALRRLKKKTYNPLPKMDGDNVGEDVQEKEKESNQEKETCTICLEDFKAEEEVMLTPCNHMFHEPCIVPWVKSHAQCPICRLRFGRLLNSNQP